jgi:hypothetical protein
MRLFGAGAFLVGRGKFSVDHGLASHGGGVHEVREGHRGNRRKFKAARGRGFGYLLPGES